MHGYDHKKIEAKWQKQWERDALYITPDHVASKKNFYTLVEFPYPSGNLHIGHWYAFAVPDIFARYKRMKGYNVMFPIGFDAFGLPAENAAIKRGLDPRKWTYENIEFMKKQIRSMGNSFDWSRMVVTCEQDYYKWTQWLFGKFHEKGLAYKGKGLVNWCDTDKTVLANEQVIQGNCERCGNPVIQKELEQWFFKITEYAERLLDDLTPLQWPAEIKEAQRNWIGRSEGAKIIFSLVDVPGQEDGKHKVKIFTTRPDTIFGATFLAVSPELAKRWLDVGWKVSEEVKRYIAEALQERAEARFEEREKTGIFSGVYAINPANKEKIPVWITNYVLGTVGTGAIMAVPAHDERDFAFAKKFHLEVREVISGGDVSKEPFTEEGLLINSGDYSGLLSNDAKKEITTFVGGTWATTYKLRDWLLSRQRYWGCPIPIVYDPEGKPHLVGEEHLPWLLPQDVDFKPTGKSPLATSKELFLRTEKLFGKGWTPEVDTMDTFVDSSWYFLRYTDPDNDKEFASRKKQKAWMPVNRYSGGAEHTTMHLLYSRFFHKALFDLGLVDDLEPFGERLNRGLILGTDGQKMSKRWGNVVDPDEQVKRVGADTVRLYLAFVGPYNETGQYPWDLGGIAGTRRFLERVWRLKEKVGDVDMPESISALMHQTIKKVGEDIESFKMNTAVSQLMIFVNALEKEDVVPNAVYTTLLTLLAPFAPHLSEELWESVGNSQSVHLESWPEVNEAMAKAREVIIVVQVQGKVRGSFSASPDLTEEQALLRARVVPGVKKWLEDKEIKQTIYIPNRIINLLI